MINKYDVFLFDFDGTLFDTLESSIYVFEEAYSHIGVKINREDILGYTREPIPISYKRVMGSMDGYDDFIADIDRLVLSQRVTDMAVIYPDTAEILKYLKGHNKTVGIVTSNAESHVLDVLNRFGLAKYFDVIIGNRQAPIPKPSPEPILKTLEVIKYKGDKKKVVYIGDSFNDVVSGIEAGVEPILLDRLFECEKHKDWKIIKTLDEIKG